jgi:hypothetical protein
MVKISESNILKFHTASFTSGVIYLSIELGLFEAIAHDKKTFFEITQILKLPERSVRLMISAAISFDLVEKLGNYYILPQDTQTYLLKDSSVYLGEWFLVSSQDERNRNLSILKEALLNGKSQICAVGNFDFLENDFAEAQKFARVMNSKSSAPSLYWPQVVDFRQTKNLLDIGGGIGTHAYSACKIWSHLEASIFELPIMCKTGYALKPKEDEVSKRISFIEGNMWEDKFPRADVHFYSDIFHDWSMEKCQYLAKKSYQALELGGQIILHEMLYAPTLGKPMNVVGYDVAMFIHTEMGQQYTENQLTRILLKAGFLDCQTHNTFGDWSIIIGTKK